MKIRTGLNIFLFVTIVLLIFSIVQLAISFAAGSHLVYTSVEKNYYQTLFNPSSKKKELLRFSQGKSQIAHHNIFDIDNRDISFGGVEIGINTDSNSPTSSKEDVLFFLDNPSSCSELAGVDLLGTIEAIPEDQSTVQIGIGKRKERETKVLRISEEVQTGITVIGIRWNVVAFQTSSGIRCLGEDVGKEANQPQNKTAKKNGASSSDNDGMVQKVGENQYVLKRAELQKMTSNLNALARQARIVPAKEGGFKIYAIKKNSIYRSIGIKNGDVIKSINGIELSSPDKALEAYSRLQTASKLSLDVKRRGETMTLDYSVE
ncbi:hypothetical protein KAH37_01985 [bacterium]|nr:hypothetical protein [bacterium]